MKPGPKPQPSNVVLLHGNASKRPAAELTEQFRPEVELPACPRIIHLPRAGMDEAKQEYLRLGEELLRYRRVSELDRGALAMIAVEWGIYAWAISKIGKANAKDPDHEKGLVESTSTGYRKQSVYFEIKNKALENYLRLGAEFGLTPSARAREIAPGVDAPQLGLPGVEPAMSGTPTLRSFA